MARNDSSPIKTEIMENVIDLIATEGIDGLSIRTIAKKISYSTGPIYYHFKDRDDMLLQIQEYCFERGMKDISEGFIASLTNNPGVDRLQETELFLLNIIEQYYSNRYLTVYLELVPNASCIDASKWWSEIINKYLEYRELDPVSLTRQVQAAAQILTIIMDGFFNTVVRNKEITKEEKKAGANLFATFTLSGLRAVFQS